MKNALKSKYKLAIIPKGTILFRKAKDCNIYNSMYFSFEAIGTLGSDYSKGSTQIWIAKCHIISRLIVKDKTQPLIYETDLEYCYKEFCGEEKYYLDIKHRNNPRLKDFLNFLKINEIDSWVTSVENHTPMEVHLFTDRNKDLIKFKKKIDNSKNYILARKKTFDKVIIIDPREF